MGGFAFLAMLATYGLVLYWYALNFERDEDGEGEKVKRCLHERIPFMVGGRPLR